MRRLQSVLFCVCIGAASVLVPSARGDALAASSTGTAPFKILALRIQKQDVFDARGVHDLTPVIPSGQRVYFEEYLKVLRQFPASSVKAELTIVTSAGADQQPTKVVYHKSVQLPVRAVRPGETILFEIARLRPRLSQGTLILPVLLKSRITYQHVAKKKTVAALICDIGKLHCHN